MTILSNLCKRCGNRFRRVFIPLKPDQYVDENGERIFDNDEDNVVIMNMCLVSGMDIGEESTVECDHFVLDTNKKNINLFGHMELQEF
jgi:hypothetical protein